MDFFNVLTLAGGLAMFLYGMRLMGDGLKESSSGTLKQIMESVTNNVFKAFLLGLAVTAIIQSSTATIVITSGLVGAGLLTLHQSLGIIIGANVGTTVTGQIIRLLDMNAEKGSWLRIFQPSSLAPIALIIGIIIIMTGSKRFSNARTIGSIAIGFGILFSGLLNMTSAVSSFAESPLVQDLFAGLGSNPLAGYLTGCFRTAELLGDHRYPAGLLLLRTPDLARHLPGHRRCLSGRLCDDRDRLFHRRPAGSRPGRYCQHPL